MKNRETILEENQAAVTIRKNQWFFLSAVVIAALFSLFLNGILLYAYKIRFPQAKFLYTSDAQAVCASIDLSEPTVSAAKVRDYASRATQAVHTFDFFNWRPQINAALQEFFTPKGRDGFRAAMQQSGVVRSVYDNYQVTSAVVSGAPAITYEGVDNGRYNWIVRIPVQVFYRTAESTKRENRIVTARVVRVPVSPVNVLGIAIDKMVSTQATIKEMRGEGQ